MKFNQYGAHLAYCTNIHPAETWQETWQALKTHTLTVRDKLLKQQQQQKHPSNDQNATASDATQHPTAAYAIGLRLSATAAEELLQGNNLLDFQQWLEKENCYVFTINGFPYGSFHGTHVKEKVYQPDWTSQARLNYSNNLFSIIARLAPEGIDGSVSTLPGSFKEFHADEPTIFKNLEACARHIEHLSNKYSRDLHMGLEPEPLGHFENTAETLAFFDRFLTAAEDPELIKRRIGINYDTCHFALEFEKCHASLDTLRAAGLRISKIHLSSALTFDPRSNNALNAIRAFDEPTYLHQVIIRDTTGKITRFKDLPDFLSSPQTAPAGRIHFHIPLYSNPEKPLGSTQNHAADALSYLKKHPSFCTHFEIETYTWGVLPNNLQICVEDQITLEYAWVLNEMLRGLTS